MIATEVTDNSRVYSQYEIQPGPFRKKDFKDGDKVLYLATRTSSCSWGNFTNKHHGYVLIRGTVKYDEDYDDLYIIPNAEDKEKWEKSIGSETVNQTVDCRFPYPRFGYVVSIIS